MVALLLCFAALVLLIPGFARPDALELIAAWPLTASRWALLCGVLVALAGLALLRDQRESRAPWHDARRALLWAGVLTPATLLWIFGEPKGPALLTAFTVAVFLIPWALLLRRSERLPEERWFFGSPRESFALLGGSIVLTLLVWWLGPRFGEIGNRGGEGVALLTYPLYAFVQLTLLLVLPLRVWRREGTGPLGAALGVGVLFALAHWPQGLLVGAGGVAAVVWAIAFQRGVPVLVLALSMGFLGAGLAQRIPADWTEHMRVGPEAVERRVEGRRYARWDARIAALADGAAWDSAGQELRPWTRRVLEEVTGGPPSESSVSEWVDALEDLHRARIVRTFYNVESFRARHGVEGGWSWVEQSAIWGSGFRPTHPAHADYDSLRSREAFAAAGGDWRRYLESLAKHLLDEDPNGQDPTAVWDTVITAADRSALVEWLFLLSGEPDPREHSRPPMATLPALPSSEDDL